jgi:hypothetical protein
MFSIGLRNYHTSFVALSPLGFYRTHFRLPCIPKVILELISSFIGLPL